MSRTIRLALLPGLLAVLCSFTAFRFPVQATIATTMESPRSPELFPHNAVVVADSTPAAKKDSVPQAVSQQLSEEDQDELLVHGDDPVASLRLKSLGSGGGFFDGSEADSTKMRDTTYVVYLDSTERLAQLRYHRSDEPTATFFPHGRYPLYLDVNSPAYAREITLDSTGSYITVRERMNGVDVKVPVTLPIEDYVKQRFEEEKARNWRSMAHEYRSGKQKDDLAGLFGSITNISIPIPANPLFSIFGKNVIDLHVTGEVNIRAAYQNQSSDQQTQSQFDKSQASPDFNQDVTINVNGLIGDKLRITADWNTQRTFEYENQLKINYTGYDDEIIQSVEAGNVSLSNVPSLIGGSEALFGIKTVLQTGPLSLTALVSQKKGKAAEVNLSGGSSQHPIEIRPQDYATNNFFIDTVYRNKFDFLSSKLIIPADQSVISNTIVQIDVWVSLPQYSASQDKRTANAFINLRPHADGTPYDSSYQNTSDSTFKAAVTAGNAYTGYFYKLSPDKYKVNMRLGYISFRDNSIDQEAVALTYRITSDPSGQGKTLYGDVTDTSKALILKLIKPPQLLPIYHPAWELQMKNIYNIGSDIKQENFKLDIIYRASGAPDANNLLGIKLLPAVGFDNYQSDNSTQGSDGQFDWLPGLTIDPQFGNIIFPSLRPFDTDLKTYFTLHNQNLTDSLLMREIYDTSKAQLAYINKNFYVIQVVAATATQSRISLGGFNVVEGSVQVLLNNTPLTPGEDYTVDYIVGEVTLKSDRALQPGANIQVKYEQNDLFQLASKTLMGARAVLDVSPNVNLGFTIMNLNQASLSDKVRIGEEPTKNTIMGVDGGFNTNLPFLTQLLDDLPLIRAKEMSTLTFRGEGAYMMPNPNTRTSTVESDNGASVAYLDDFEGSKRTISLPITYAAWVLGSPPYYSLLDTTASRTIVKTDSELTYSKARLSWYNNASNFNAVNVNEIWPNKSVATQDQFVNILYMDYDPLHRGQYNFSPNLDSTLHRQGTAFDNVSDRRKNWNGIMRYVATTAGDLLSQNINFIELWVNTGEENDPGIPLTPAQIEDMRHGKLYIDLGRISEDIIPNNQLNSEDIVPTSSNPGGIPTGHVQPGADIGLDMLSDDQEKSVYANFVARNNDKYWELSGDPSGDDYSYNTGQADLTHINGTEFSYDRNSPAGRLPDTEDLNNNSALDATNSYLEYEIPLDSVYYDSTNTLVKNPFIVGGNLAQDRSKRWYQIRIPLNNKTRLVSPGAPQNDNDILQNVQYVRMWVSGYSERHKIRFAEMDLVGNQWAEEVKNDSTFKVSVVNIEDNPDYTIPPGVVRALDRTRPDQQVYGNEQSLSLILNNLPQGQTRSAVKVNTGRAVDMFSYKTMKMFMHGDQTFVSTPNHHDAEGFIRFGADTNNYYEYRQPIQAGWFEMTVNFAQLTTIKSLRDNAKGIVLDSLYKLLYKSGPYGVKGRPALTQIQYFAVGVTNPAAPNGRSLLTGTVWVNELRVTDADNSTGYAYHFDTQLKLSDFGNVAFNYAYTDPNFHGLEDRFGSRLTNTNWAMNSSFSFDKYFPLSMQGTSLAVNYSHSEGLSKPKYLPGTDILVDAAAQSANDAAIAAGAPAGAHPGDSLIIQSQTLHVQDSYSIGNFRLVLPWRTWILDETINKVTYSFSYNLSRDRNPTLQSGKAWSWAFGTRYGNNIPFDGSFQPFKSIFGGIPVLSSYKDWKFYYEPVTSISTSVDASRSASLQVSRVYGLAPTNTRGFSANKSFGFGWRATDGGLLNLSGDYGLTISRDLLFLDNDTLGRGFSKIIQDIFIGGRDGSYSQRVTVNSKPKVPEIFDIPKYFDLSAGYNVTYDWHNIFQSGDLGKSARWGNSITISSTLRLKSLTDPWFKSLSDNSGPLPAPEQIPVAMPAKNDSTHTGKDSTTVKPKEPGKKMDIFGPAKFGLKYLIKVPFLDFETMNIQFSQQNGVASGGVVGSTGFMNFWGRSPFQSSLIQNGPSRLYQLGLISDPSGTLEYKPSSGFPFIGWRTVPGLRAPNGIISDQYNQSNNVTLHTTKPLWEGAQIDLNWKVGWSYARTTQDSTDSYGRVTPTSVLTSGHIERSFVSLPPVFFLKYLNSNLADVSKKYTQLASTEAPDVALADAFEKGLEAAPFLNRVLGQYVPRANWTVRWDGLQKIGFLGSAFKQLSLDHAYTSSFSRDFVGNPDGTQLTSTERVTYAFNPLVGLSGTPKDFLGGAVSGSFKYGTSTTYDLSITAHNITQTQTADLAFSVNYGRHGFSLPFFGVNLVNDVDITMTYSVSKNSRRLFDPTTDENPDGTPLDGTTRTTMEPRFRYGLSSRVNASLFYRYSKIAPDEGGSTIFGTTTNEAGVDIHISIQ